MLLPETSFFQRPELGVITRQPSRFSVCLRGKSLYTSVVLFSTDAKLGRQARCKFFTSVYRYMPEKHGGPWMWREGRLCGENELNRHSCSKEIKLGCAWMKTCICHSCLDFKGGWHYRLVCEWIKLLELLLDVVSGLHIFWFWSRFTFTLMWSSKHLTSYRSFFHSWLQTFFG